MHEITNKVDFYITNVCNLTCEGCNRFNNHDFRGWQRWSDYQTQYEQWGNLVKLKAATIMGGEPFLNPTLHEWIQGINRIFGIEVQILTNGTRFKQAKDLYNALLYESPVTGAKNHIGVSLHNINDQEEILNSIREFFPVPFMEYPRNDPANYWNSDWHFVDNNGVMVNVYVVNKFNNSTLINGWQISGGIKQHYTLHNSDVNDAYNICPFAKIKSYHFIRGKLYKCAPVALLPEFDQQHQLSISPTDRQLLTSYQPLDVDNFERYSQEFFDKLDQPIPQCKFCPSKIDVKSIFPIRKGT